MKPQALFISALGSAMLLSAIPAHSQTTDLEEILTSSIKERVQMPLLFSTRDTTFALSLPDDEPAEVYLHVTVDRKGRVKEKLTRVNANHLGAYVAPTFADATKELRVPNETMPALAGKDTSLLLTFSLEYQCMLDTVSAAQPNAVEELNKRLKLLNTADYPKRVYPGKEIFIPMTISDIEKHSTFLTIASAERAIDPRYRDIATPIWYYLAFFKEE